MTTREVGSSVCGMANPVMKTQNERTQSPRCRHTMVLSLPVRQAGVPNRVSAGARAETRPRGVR